MGKKGVALLVVLGMFLVAVILANVVLQIISSQPRLTHHQVSRIQAYYAAMAGINFALEQLRTGAWTFTPVNSCPNPVGQLINDADFPTSIRSFDGSLNRQVRIIFCPPGVVCVGTPAPCNPPPGINFCVNATVDYLYTP